ncbi:unnamed protein product, partial [marine sediment metagenome]
ILYNAIEPDASKPSPQGQLINGKNMSATL